MKLVLILGLILSATTSFADESICDQALNNLQNISHLAGQWDFKYRVDVAEHEAAATIKLSKLNKEGALKEANKAKRLAKEACRF